MNKLIKISVFVLVFSFLSFVSSSVVSAEETIAPEVESVVEVTEEPTPEVVEETPIPEVTEEPTPEVVEEESLEDESARLMMTTVIEESTATISATKIVCDSETDLPNWGNGGADITATTADDFLASHPNCKKAASWPFEWAPNGTANPGDNATGSTGGAWTAFSGTATVPAGSLVWVREQVNSDYISFTGDTTDPRDDNISAELYCNTDVLNYDNYDWVNPVEAGETYHCIGFNVAKPVDVCLNMEGMQTEAPNGYKIVYQNDQSECVPVCGVHEITLYSDESNMVNGDDEAVPAYDENPTWTANIPGAQWIWDTFYTQNPTQDETRVFTKTFNIVGDIESATLDIASDNTYKVSFNAFLNVFSATDSNSATDHNFTSTGQDSYNVASYLSAGSNTVSFEITNLALENGTKFNNPSGLLYKLHVVSNDCADNIPPVANAGADQTLTLPTNSTTLNGSLSTDSDGTIVSYVWDFVSGPSSINPIDVVTTAQGGLIAGTYVFQLTVTDDNGATGTDTVTIVVNNPVCRLVVLSDTTNLVNGDNNAVLAWDENVTWTASIPGAVWIWDTYQTANPTLDETKVFTKTFNMPSGMTQGYLMIAADNEYKVSINSSSNIFSAADSNSATDHNFTSTGQDFYNALPYLVAGSNTITFEVKNLALENGTSTNNPSGLMYSLEMLNENCGGGGENNPPIANAGADQTLTLPTNSTTLNGSLSTDSDGTIVSYAWIQVSGPSLIDPANVMNYDISNLVIGTYVFQLIVTDNDGAMSVADTVTITVNPQDGDNDSICSDGIDNDGDNLIDFPEDPGCESSSDDSEDDRRILGGGGVGIRRGSVLGAQDTVCDFSIDTYMRRGYNNNKEQVKVLQGLLNKYVEAGLAIDGHYGPQTEAAVVAFQIKYRDTILDPWNIENPTGIFFRTSLVQAQNLECPDPELPIPENLINWSDSRGEVPAIVPVRIPLSLNYYYGI